MSLTVGMERSVDYRHSDHHFLVFRIDLFITAREFISIAIFMIIKG